MSVFTLERTDGGARAGVLHTPHGDVPTPVFMPVATQASVKAIGPDDLRTIGATIVLANTYHLYLRPGVDVIDGLGGLGRFMSWDGPTLTDSGGFQGFSLEHLREITEDGIIFKSHIDGSLHTFTPEAVIRHQEGIGADVITPLDVCVPASSDRHEVAEAVERTGRWAARSLETHSRGGQILFGIVQGGLDLELRLHCLDALVSLAAPGPVGDGDVEEPSQGSFGLGAQRGAGRRQRHG